MTRNPYEEEPPVTGIDLIIDEQDRVKKLPNAAEIAETEEENTRNDRIAIALAYLGRASERVHRNMRESQDPLDNLVKAGAVIVAAIDAEIAVREKRENQHAF
jgi:hypothetical protein